MVRTWLARSTIVGKAFRSPLPLFAEPSRWAVRWLMKKEKSMFPETPKIPFSTFLYAALVGYFAFAIPAIIILILLKLMEIKPLLFFIALPITIIFITVSAVLSWLFAKSSNWVKVSAALKFVITALIGSSWSDSNRANASTAIMGTCIFPGGFFGFLLGLLIGTHLFSGVWGFLFIAPVYLGVSVLAVILGKFLAKKLLPELVLRNS